ncbi:MAG: twin-arginine translocase subunit TatC [Deltaproteobacteria bacterium]|nr:twin-arginine translocase subunit TatC [Deltaproteobacteria bacterium]
MEKARKGLAACLALFLGLTAACFAFSERALEVLVRLLGRNLVSFSPEEGFIALASLSVYCAFVLTLPVAGILLWRAVVLPRVPGWRKWSIPVFAAATALFFSGVLLGYHVILPAGIGFLVGFETEGVRAYISARKFISFCGGMLIALGLSFETPLLSFFLARLGWLKADFFLKRWRQAIIICTVLAAIITPTPDIYNMMLMMGPLLGLYFVSFLVVLAAKPTAKPGR